MKTFVVLAVSIVLVSILFCPMVMAAPPMPDNLQIVQPDPSLPKELSGFFGKWEGAAGAQQYFLIVEKIDEEKASLWLWRSGWADSPRGWDSHEAKVIKERGKYKIWSPSRFGNMEFTLKGEYLDSSGPWGGGTPGGSVRFRRVP
jgi:hypothetical protein